MRGSDMPEGVYSESACGARLAAILAPRTGDVGRELALELSEYLGIPIAAVDALLLDATARFTDEWRRQVADPTDEHAVTRFYNDSKAELFDLVHWHSHDRIHARSLICADLARARGAVECLDFGSGIGSDALVFASVGCRVTLADIAAPLAAFARWRFERRGLPVRSIDLKRERLPARAFDAAVCFDVLEHVPRPLRAIDAIGRSLRPGGLLFMHAPFGEDPDRPMHVVHEDVVTPRMRSVGFNWRGDLESPFPGWLWHPRVYEAFALSALDRVAYRAYDTWLRGRAGDALARGYRRLRPQRTTNVASSG